jgi:hypothetical protein
MGKFLNIELNKLRNPSSTSKVLTKRAVEIDAALDLGPDEEIQKIYADNGFIGKGYVFIFTNLNVYAFLKEKFVKATVNDFSIRDGLFNQTFIIFNGTTYIVYFAWEKEVVKSDITKLLHPNILGVFRLEVHINYLKSCLDSGEKILFLFSGYGENWDLAHPGSFPTTVGCLTSNEALLFASKGLIGAKSKRIQLSDLKEITIINKFIKHLVIFETITEQFIIDVGSMSSSKKISEIIREYKIKFNVKNKKNNDNNDFKANFSVADELLKFKQLLDAGLITTEEFEKKKQELLGKSI